MTVPLGQTTPAVFTCTGRGLFVTWILNGTEIQDLNDYAAENSDVEVNQLFNSNGCITDNKVWHKS